MKFEQKPVGLGRVILWGMMTALFFIGFIGATLFRQNNLVLLIGVALVMCITATYTMYKNYKGQKSNKKK